MKRIRVTLRKKSISNGRLSLYLDYYPPFFNSESGNYSRREFLKLYLIAKPSSQIEKILNAENLHRTRLDIQATKISCQVVNYCKAKRFFHKNRGFEKKV